ncbi:MAG: hypothetical protein JNN07_13695 [Verrucomicrobiales bacterium]|nr:hypothetical protein [Verrucomicrobiales bacterium]
MRRTAWSFATILVVAIYLSEIRTANFRRELRAGVENSVWAQSLYLRGYQPTTSKPLTPADLKRFCDTLRANKIKYAYLFAGPYDTNGMLPDYVFSPTARSSVETIRRDCPELILLPWVGGIVNKTVFIDDLRWVSNAINETSRLLKEQRFAGVHVNFEFFTHQISDEFYPGLRGLDHYGEDEIQFFQALRKKLPSAFISTVAVSTSPMAVHWKRKNTFDEIRSISKYVDQIAILCFDTSISDRRVFKESLRLQVENIKAWKASARGTQFLIGVGTFVNKAELWKFRDLEVESIANTSRTLQDVLNEPQPRETPLVDGLAIFAEWTTDETEWRQLRENWFDR